MSLPPPPNNSDINRTISKCARNVPLCLYFLTCLSWCLTCRMSTVIRYSHLTNQFPAPLLTSVIATDIGNSLLHIINMLGSYNTRNVETLFTANEVRNKMLFTHHDTRTAHWTVYSHYNLYSAQHCFLPDVRVATAAPNNAYGTAQSWLLLPSWNMTTMQWLLKFLTSTDGKD